MAENKILLIHEVAERLRVSTSTISRWLGQARRGQSTFPLPISATGGKGRWMSADIDRWLALQSAATIPMPAKTKRRNDGVFQERQSRATAVLQRHGLNRKTNPCEA